MRLSCQLEDTVWLPRAVLRPAQVPSIGKVPGAGSPIRKGVHRPSQQGQAGDPSELLPQSSGPSWPLSEEQMPTHIFYLPFISTKSPVPLSQDPQIAPAPSL